VTCVLGIDPGVSGALAFYYVQERRVAVYDMPLVDGDVNPHEFTRLVMLHQPDVAIIEKVHPMPREGVSSVWRFAAAYTTARVSVMLLNIQLITVSPSHWKKVMNVAGGKAGKEQCLEAAIRLFPGNAAAFSRKKDHGRAEAALLAIYQSNHRSTYERLPAA